MNRKTILCGLALWLTALVGCEHSDAAKKVTELAHSTKPSGEKCDKASAVALGIVWARYWVHEYGEETILSQASEPLTVWVDESSKIAEVSAYAERWGLRVDLTKDGAGNWQPSYVETHFGCPTSRPDSWKEMTITIPGDLIHRVCNPPDESAQVRRLVRSVLSKQENDRWLNESREFGTGMGKVWMSPRIAGYPWIYYHVEGVPYLGEIAFDEQTWSIVHEDAWCIRETPRELDKRHLIDRMQRQGYTDRYIFEPEGRAGVKQGKQARP